MHDFQTATLHPSLTAFSQYFALNRIPHALLLIQENGKDLAQHSQLLASWLLCEKPIVSGAASLNAHALSDSRALSDTRVLSDSRDLSSALGACGHCRSCVLYREKSHPDYYVFGTEGSNTGVDEIRGLNEALQQTSHQSGRKVVVLHGVDRYLPGSANALLKILEEPIGDVVYLLLAQRRQRIMPTISSRCVKMMIDSTNDVLSPLQLQCQQLFLNPQTTLFNDPTLQEWMIENAQDALWILYDVIKTLVKESYDHSMIKTLVKEECEHPIKACINEGYDHKRSICIATLKHMMKFTDEIVLALKQAALPGINKLLLLESIFYRWQEIKGIKI